MIFAPKNAGKTFLALDLAYAFATGGRFLGKRIRKPGPVVGIFAEGGGRIQVRASAYRRAHRISAPVADLHLTRRALNLLDDEQVAGFIDTVLLPISPRLVILDTWSRNIPGAEENNQKEMTTAIAALDRMRHAVPGLTGLVLHHPTKSNDDLERGSSVISGAIDTVMGVKVEPCVRRLWCKYQRDAEHFSEIPFALVTEDTDYCDDDGRSLTSCVVRALDEDGVRRAMDKSTILQDLVLAAIRPAPLSANSLAAALGRNKADVLDALKELKDRGLVDRIGRGKASKWTCVTI